MTAESGDRRKMVPAPVPAELFILSHSISVPGQPALVVYACRLCGSFVPEEGRELHRRYHEDLAQMMSITLRQQGSVQS